MTVTQEGQREGRQGFAEAVRSTEPEAKVILKILKAGNGLNIGEVARFPTSVASRMVAKGDAKVHVQAAAVAGLLGGAVDRAINLLRVANDAKSAIAVQVNEVAEAVRAADEAVHVAFEQASVELGNGDGGRAVLEEAHAAATEREGAAAKDADTAVKDAKRELTNAKKAVKKADDKDEANAAVTASEGKLEAAEFEVGRLGEDIAKQVSAREEEIAGVDDAAASSQASIDATMGELEKVLKESSDLDSELNGIHGDE